MESAIKAADVQNILENHKLQIFQNISLNIYKSRSEPGNAPRIGIGHREVVCQK